MDDVSKPAPIPGWLVAVAAACVWILQASVGVWIVAYTRHDLLAACEGDGHFMRAAYLHCGDDRLFRQVGGGSWPWGYPWAASQVSRFTGSAYLSARLVSVVSMATLTTTVFVSAWQHWRSLSSALVAAAVIGCTPQLIYYGVLASTDLMAVAVSTLALPFVLAVLRGEDTGVRAFTVGAVSALGGQVRYQVFPLALVLFVVLGLAAKPGQRLWAWVGFGVGFVCVLAVCSALPWASPGDLGGLAVAWGARDQPQAMPSSLGELARRYAHSGALAAWHVNFLPLFGLAAILAVGLDRGQRRRDALVPLAPIAAEFLALGWFPTGASSELRRLFLPMLPACALGSAVVWRRVHAWDGRGRPYTTLITVWFLALSVNQFFGEFPLRSVFASGVPVPGIGFDSPQRLWDFEGQEGRAEELRRSRSDHEHLHAFLDHHDLGCGLTVTNSVLASTLLAEPFLCAPGSGVCTAERGLDTEAFAALLQVLETRHGVRWVLEAPYKGRFWIDPTLPLGASTSLTLTLRDGPEGFHLYELVGR